MQGSRNQGWGAPQFATFSEFLKYAGNEDRQCLLDEQGWERRFTEAACGMANIAGGWIILGAEEADRESLPSQGDSFSLPGLKDSERVQASAANLLSEACSAPLRARTQFLSDERLLLVRVEPALWHDRPVCVRRGHRLDYARGSYRRVEGVDVASGLRTRFLLGMDSLERLRDDRPIPGSKAQDLDAESLAAFREQVVSLRRSWAGLAPEAFLSRTLVLSGSQVTEAGRLLLGKEAVAVHVSLHGGGALDVPNLWRACALLPRLTRSLSPACRMAFRECFFNALLHADYSAGGVTVELSEGSSGQIEARLENFGLVRDTEVPLCRNFRLMRIFQLMGLARGEGTGLKLIRRYAPFFRLEQDSLELRTTAVLPLEPAEGIEDTPERSHSEMPLLLAAAPLFSLETEPGKTPEPEPVPEPEIAPETEPIASPEPELANIPAVAPKQGPAPEPEITPTPTPEPATAPEPEPMPEPTSIPEVAPEPEPAPKPEIIPAPEPIETPESEPIPEPANIPEVAPEPEPAPEPEIITAPELIATPETELVPELANIPEVAPEPEPAPEPQIIPTPEPAAALEPELVPDPVSIPEVTPEQKNALKLEIIPDPEPFVLPELEADSEPKPASSSEPEPGPEPTPEQLLFGEDHVVSLEERILMEQIKALSESEQIQRISEMMDERAGDGVGREQKEGTDRPSRGLFGSAEDDLRQAIAEMREAEEERARAAARNGAR